MKIGIINLHSFVDVITNSSTEIYVCSKGQSIKYVEEIIDDIVSKCSNDDDEYSRYDSLRNAIEVYEYTQEMYDKEVREAIKSTRRWKKNLIQRLKDRKPLSDYKSYTRVNGKLVEKEPSFDIGEFIKNLEYINKEEFDKAGNKNWVGKVVIKCDDWIGECLLDRIQNAFDFDFQDHW